MPGRPTEHPLLLDARSITAAISRGDRAAFARLYEAKFDLVYLSARRACGRDEATCLDIVQDAMMRVLSKIKPLPDEPTLDAWLRRTTTRAAYDWLRAEGRRGVRQAVAASGAAESAGDEVGSGPSGADRAERLAWLRQELGLLDRSAADALDFRVRAGMTLAQAGRLLGLKPGAVDGRVTRAVDALRAKAEERFDG